MRKSSRIALTDEPDGPVLHHVQEVSEVPCESPANHARSIVGKGICLICQDHWLKSLPWHPSRSRGMFRDADDDKALFALIMPDHETADRYSATIRDCWAGYGKQWEGYVCEMFGVKIGEFDDPDQYPFWRLQIASKPRLVVHLLRLRYCYEPQMVKRPIYLEIIVRPFFKSSLVSIKGLDVSAEIGLNDLRPILRAREHLFNIDSLSFLNLNDSRFIEQTERFKAAARGLAEDGKPFTIPNLIRSSRYKSRNSWYAFLDEVRRVEGNEKASRIEAIVKKEYEDALRETK